MVDFWMNIDGRLMYIIYIEVRDKEGKYLGTLEVAQDIKKDRSGETLRRIVSF